MDKLFGAYCPCPCYTGQAQLTGDARLKFLRKCVSALSARASRLSTYNRHSCKTELERNDTDQLRLRENVLTLCLETRIFSRHISNVKMSRNDRQHFFLTLRPIFTFDKISRCTKRQVMPVEKFYVAKPYILAIGRLTNIAIIIIIIYYTSLKRSN